MDFGERRGELSSILKQGDCLNIMKSLPDKCVDLILCDLPYGTTRNKWDAVIPFQPLWAEYKRLCKGAIVLTCAQPFTSALVMSNVACFKQALVWKKNKASNFLNAHRFHLARHEDVLLFSFSKFIYNPQKALGKPYVVHRKSVTENSGKNYDLVPTRTDTINQGTRFPISVLEFDRETGLHPTQKPVALMEYLIKTYSDEGDTVLDNCMGSGTTGVACERTKRNFIGIEMNEDYFRTASDRINKEIQESMVKSTRAGEQKSPAQFLNGKRGNDGRAEKGKGKVPDRGSDHAARGTQYQLDHDI